VVDRLFKPHKRSLRITVSEHDRNTSTQLRHSFRVTFIHAAAKRLTVGVECRGGVIAS
jgi:hypothetical protein